MLPLVWEPLASLHALCTSHFDKNRKISFSLGQITHCRRRRHMLLWVSLGSSAFAWLWTSRYEVLLLGFLAFPLLHDGIDNMMQRQWNTSLLFGNKNLCHPILLHFRLRLFLSSMHSYMSKTWIRCWTPGTATAFLRLDIFVISMYMKGGRHVCLGFSRSRCLWSWQSIQSTIHTASAQTAC